MKQWRVILSFEEPSQEDQHWEVLMRDWQTLELDDEVYDVGVYWDQLEEFNVLLTPDRYKASWQEIEGKRGELDTLKDVTIEEWTELASTNPNGRTVEEKLLLGYLDSIIDTIGQIEYKIQQFETLFPQT